MEDIIFKMWFINLPISNFEKLNILSANVTPCEFWGLKLKDYINIGLDMIKSQKIENSKNLDAYKGIVEYIIKEKIQLILYGDNNYPEKLKYIYNPPAGILVKGNIPDIDRSIAVVGARNASEYGKTIAYKFAYELSSRGITIISGMARGIDSCAHRGAIEGKGLTIAVMGSGFKHIYPTSNNKLFQDITNNGCVITEYMPDMMPLPYNFPERNRIISGLAKYVLIVEAGERSGSLITANLALEQGKDVFAVPGNILSPNSFGTHKLIKEGAKLISGIEDILSEYDMAYSIKELSGLDTHESSIIDLLQYGGATIEYLLEKLKIDPNCILSTLSKLECRRVIKRTYGNYYTLC
jgi:DNA processing protein